MSSFKSFRRTVKPGSEEIKVCLYTLINLLRNTLQIKQINFRSAYDTREFNVDWKLKQPTPVPL